MTADFTVFDLEGGKEGPLARPLWQRPPACRFRIKSTPGLYAQLVAAIVKGRFAPGPANAELERALEARFEVGRAVTVNQARVGIYLALRAVLQPERPRVVMSPYTIYDVVNMVLAAGGEPVFVDIDPRTCNIDPTAAISAIDDRTGVVLVTHLHGLATPMAELVAACRERGVTLIEDSAQAFGVSTESGRQLGAFGDIGIFSFGLFKTVNSFFGGAVLCRDPAVGARVEALQSGFGENTRDRMIKRLIQGLVFEVASWPPIFKTSVFWLLRHAVLAGNEQVLKLVRSENNPVRRDTLPDAYHCRMSDLQARMILRQMDDMDAEAAVRVETAEIYYRAMNRLPGVIQPASPPDVGNGCLAYPVQVPHRDRVIEEMARLGRDCAPQHLHNCADLEAFAEFHRDCPNARKASNSVLLLPTYSRYGKREAERTVAALDLALRKVGD